MKQWKAIAGLGVSAALVAMTTTAATASGAPTLVGKTHGVTLNFMIASSGPAETNADKAAAAAGPNRQATKSTDQFLKSDIAAHRGLFGRYAARCLLRRDAHVREHGEK